MASAWPRRLRACVTRPAHWASTRLPSTRSAQARDGPGILPRPLVLRAGPIDGIRLAEEVARLRDEARALGKYEAAINAERTSAGWPWDTPPTIGFEGGYHRWHPLGRGGCALA